MNSIFRRCLGLRNSIFVSTAKTSIATIQGRSCPAWQVGHHTTKARGIHLQAVLLNDQQSSQIVDDSSSTTSLFTQHPQLNKPEAYSLYQLLSSYHFTDQDILDIIQLYPELIKNNLWEQVNRTLMVLSSLKIKKKHLLKAVRSNPQLLLMTDKELLDRIDELSKYLNRKAVQHMFEYTPEALFQDKDEIKKIIHFVLFIMHLPMNELLVSKALNYDFAHLKTRYEYLVRTGLYKENSEKVKHMKNPTLTTIIQTPEEEFARIPDNMTVDDFRTFARFLEREKDPFLEALFQEELELEKESDEEDLEELEGNDRIL